MPVVLSEGKQPGDALPTPQAFEYSGSPFAPIFSIDTLLRQLDSEYASYAEQQGWFETKPGSYHQRLWVNKHCISMRTEIHGYIG
ncbi:hypothetical protein [Ferrimonas lipolytica]|uniref:Uncharacterized protein n=1 Tax=Ferrimonas lipolytica TaxID=2724191 RepID=A0A6H1UGK1_9GAMM|nr:hypothetical protein [Ferrimonas lipolytica]QIZ77730.1 hypothetical protein HER31_12980 [Ferrimonas lipolytica]